MVEANGAAGNCDKGFESDVSQPRKVCGACRLRSWLAMLVRLPANSDVQIGQKGAPKLRIVAVRCATLA
jgi:hypothetical protein